MERREKVRCKTAAEAEGDLGHPLHVGSRASTSRQSLVRPCHRQQTSRLRSRQGSHRRPRRWGSRAKPCDGHTAEDQAPPSNSSCWSRLDRASWHGSNVVADRSTASPFRAESITPTISAPGNMRGLLTSGSPGSAYGERIMERTHSAGQRQR